MQISGASVLACGTEIISVWQILFSFEFFFFPVIFQAFPSPNELLTEACLNIYGVVSSLEQCINPLCLYLSQGWVRCFKIALSSTEHFVLGTHTGDVKLHAQLLWYSVAGAVASKGLQTVTV